MFQANALTTVTIYFPKRSSNTDVILFQPGEGMSREGCEQGEIGR